MRKGIILAGGKGTRLYPLTKVISKQLLPIFDKPMIYYPLSTLMMSGIRDILIISTPDDLFLYEKLLGSGSQLGINISYAVQDEPGGLAQAFIIGKKFIGQDKVALILGDNIFFGANLDGIFSNANNSDNATIFAYQVNDPQRYGVVEFDDTNKAITIEEKPQYPRSNFAVTGIYFYNNDVINLAENLSPSERGELEITDINSIYLKNDSLFVGLLGRGYSWLDTGTHSSLLEASLFVSTIQSRQGYLVGSPEEISFKNNWISKDQLQILLDELYEGYYKDYLKKLLI